MRPPFDMGKLPSPLLIIGAAHTGKSEMATDILEQTANTAVFGTADPKESAFKDRINQLKSLRPTNWDTWEDNQNITEILTDLDSKYKQILIDSLNQWVASRILNGVGKYSTTQLEQLVSHEASTIMSCLQNHSDKRIVIVTSEVGSGISPPHKIPRLFRQMASRVNCRFAQIACSVVLITAGIPLLLKEERGERRPLNFAD